MNIYRFRAKLWTTEHKEEKEITVEARDLLSALKKFEAEALKLDSLISLEVMFGAAVKISKG